MSFSLCSGKIVEFSTSKNDLIAFENRLVVISSNGDVLKSGPAVKLI